MGADTSVLYKGYTIWNYIYNGDLYLEKRGDNRFTIKTETGQFLCRLVLDEIVFRCILTENTDDHIFEIIGEQVLMSSKKANFKAYYGTPDKQEDVTNKINCNVTFNITNEYFGNDPDIGKLKTLTLMDTENNKTVTISERHKLKCILNGDKLTFYKGDLNVGYPKITLFT